MDAVAVDYAVVDGNGPMTKRSKVLLSASFLSGCALAFVVLALCEISGISGNYTYLRTKQADPHQSTKSPQLSSGDLDTSVSPTAIEEGGDLREMKEAMEHQTEEAMERVSLLPPEPRLGSAASPNVRQGVSLEQQIGAEKQQINVEPVKVDAGDGPRL